MRVFEHANTSCDWVCPICKKNDDKPVALVPIQGTSDGHICEATQIHVDCIDPTMVKAESGTYLIQKIGDKKND